MLSQLFPKIQSMLKSSFVNFFIDYRQIDLQMFFNTFSTMVIRFFLSSPLKVFSNVVVYKSDFIFCTKINLLLFL
jgi:hypothetical protein